MMHTFLQGIDVRMENHMLRVSLTKVAKEYSFEILEVEQQLQIPKSAGSSVLFGHCLH